MRRPLLEQLACRRRLLGSIVLLALLSLATLIIRAAADDGPCGQQCSVPAKLQQLKPGHGVLLGDASVNGAFNAVAREFALDSTGPRARDYSVKMVWAPDRGRALFLGANHGSPHRLNDVWEFELGSLTWSLLYPPDNPRSYTGMGEDASDVIFRDGVLQTMRGGPAVIGHTWWGLAYNPTSRKVVFMNTWVTDLAQVIKSLDGDINQLFKGPPVWTFDPSDGAWHMERTEPPYPKIPFAGLLEYVDVLDGMVWHSNHWQMQATWLYRGTSHGWTKLAEHGAENDYLSQVPPQEQVGYYDSHRKQLVVMRGGRIAHFDVIARKWRKVLDLDGGQDSAPDAHDARTPVYFDPISGHGVLFDLTNSAIWAYDPDNPSWIRQSVSGDPPPEGDKRLVYLDPMHNVLVVIDSRKVWAYRYRGRD